MIFVLGGTRSGKSVVAERITMGLPPPTTYLATMLTDGSDADLTARIAAHLARRPAGWRTVDVGADLPGQLGRLAGTVLLDSLGPWVAAHRPDDATVDAVVAALTARVGATVVVSDEVGLSVHPPTESGRDFQETLGRVNARIGAVADQAWLVVAGRLCRLEPPDTALGIARDPA